MEHKTVTRLLYLALTGAANGFGWYLGGLQGLLLLPLCLGFWGLAEWNTVRTDRELAQLSQTLNRILHGEEHLGVEEYSEGELGILRSEIHKMTVRLREQQQALQADKVYLANSLADLSHQLRTPLTSISGIAEIMQSGMVKPEDIQSFAGDIYQEAQRLIALVEDIIHLSQLDEGAVPMDREEIDLHALARDVLDRLAPAAEKGRVQLRLDGEKAVVTGVRHVVDEMVFNLADNAVKYNRPGGSVTITTGMEKGKPWFSVADTGIGIPADSRERVFERFYRVDKSHSKDVGGTGLGLSIVKHAAAYLGASLELRSEVGEGTTVTARWN